MNILILFLTTLCLMVVTECCMRMVPPDDVYIPSTLAPVESTMAPGESTEAPMAPSTTNAAEETSVTEVILQLTNLSKFQLVSEQLCKISEATCPDLASVLSANVIITTDTEGCIELSCAYGFVPFLGASFDDSEIPPPTPGTPVTPGEIVEKLNGYFGLVCENNKLTATEYPIGIGTFSGSGTYGADGSYSGKKSALNQVDCE
eukprot:NP_494262.1 Uncharacterized protein CELE_F16G10.8 [Caenorhabditis elegans]